ATLFPALKPLPPRQVRVDTMPAAPTTLLIPTHSPGGDGFAELAAEHRPLEQRSHPAHHRRQHQARWHRPHPDGTSSVRDVLEPAGLRRVRRLRDVALLAPYRYCSRRLELGGAARFHVPLVFPYGRLDSHGPGHREPRTAERQAGRRARVSADGCALVARG